MVGGCAIYPYIMHLRASACYNQYFNNNNNNNNSNNSICSAIKSEDTEALKDTEDDDTIYYNIHRVRKKVLLYFSL